MPFGLPVTDRLVLQHPLVAWALGPEGIAVSVAMLWLYASFASSFLGQPLAFYLYVFVYAWIFYFDVALPLSLQVLSISIQQF